MADRIPSAAIVFYENHTNPKPLSVDQLPWAEVIDLFSEHEFTECNPCPGGKKCQKKFSFAFSPGVPRAGTSRLDKNVDWVSLLVFDFDHLTFDELQGVSDRLSGLESLLSSTHSHLHGGPDDCCVRIILPLARPLTPEEYRVVHHEVRRRYGLEWVRAGKAKPNGADPNARDTSRLYFLPTAPVGSETLVGHEEGALLDLDELLKGFVPEPAQAAPEGVSTPTPERPADMGELHRLLRGYHPKHKERDDDEAISRKELVRRAEAGEPLVQVEERGQRERSCHRLGKILANLLPDGVSVEAMTELVRASIMSMPTYEDDGEKDTIEERFKKLAYSWDRGREARGHQKETWAAEKVKGDLLRERIKKRFNLKSARAPAPDDDDDPPPPSAPPPPPPGDGEPPEDDNSTEGWEGLLVWTQKKDGSRGPLKNVDGNADTLLTYHPDWHQVLKYNEVTKDVIPAGGPLIDYENTPAQITSGVKYWLQRHPEYSLALATKDVMGAILHAAKSNAFDPLKDYLNGLIWDGVDRLDTFLEHYCGAQTKDGTGKDITEHIRKISRRWLISAVARGLDPGCKVDTVLILEGEQGIKKSMLLDALGGEWFADSAINIADKDSKMLAGRSWIVEMPELSAMHASETESQKAFFSSRVDKFRPPYGYAIEVFPRRCVFVGSTNDERYMNDITGNRRYWAARCGDFLIKQARRDRDQIWAQAVAVYKASSTCAQCAAAKDGEERCPEHRWWLNQAENKVLESINNQRLKNEYAEAILDYILKIEPAKRPGAFSMYDIATRILSLTADRLNSQHPAIGRALKTLGFEKDRRMENGIRTVWHIVPEGIMRSPRRVPGREHLTPVPKPDDDEEVK